MGTEIRELTNLERFWSGRDARGNLKPGNASISRPFFIAGKDNPQAQKDDQQPGRPKRIFPDGEPVKSPFRVDQIFQRKGRRSRRGQGSKQTDAFVVWLHICNMGRLLAGFHPERDQFDARSLAIFHGPRT